MRALPQRLGEDQRVLRAGLGLDGQRHGHRHGQLTRHQWVELLQWDRRLALLLEGELGQRRGFVGQPTRQELIGDDAQRVDVGPRAGLFAPGLFGGQVGGGAEDRAHLGNARLVGGPSDPEVGQLDHLGVRHE